MDRMLAGVSMRRFALVGEPVGEVIERDSFRRIIGYRDLAKLAIAIERHTVLDMNTDRQEIAEPVTV